MRTIRNHVDLPLTVGRTLRLPEDTSAHLLKVLRLGAGASVWLFNGDGFDYEARLLDGNRRGAEAEVVGRREVDNEPPLHVTLAQGIARGEKMDLVLQKATELGVAAFAPVISERTEVKLDAERAGKRIAHWRGVIASACAQSGRARIPALAEPATLARYAADEDAGLKLVLDPRGGSGLRELPLVPGGRVALVAGPEGGLSARDLQMLKAAGFRGLRLGPRILRTETAGIAAIAALQALHGDLG